MSQFEYLSIVLNALALVLQAISALHAFVNERRPTSTDKQIREGNHEQNA